MQQIPAVDPDAAIFLSAGNGAIAEQHSLMARQRDSRKQSLRVGSLV
jgi:hypothetical protein